MPENLLGKVAVITGGASGIGRASVEAFVAEGASVVIADIQDDTGQALAESLGDAAIYVHTDVRDENQIAGAVEAAVAQFGRLDIMFNNAGHPGDPSPITEIKVDSFLDTVNLLAGSVVAGHKYAGQQFRRQGGGGSIISTSSIASVQSGYGAVGYAASKAAIGGIVRTAAFELGADGIRSNAIVPGAIVTPIFAKFFGIDPALQDDFMGRMSSELLEHHPIGRLGQANDIAGAAVFLGSDASSFITGTQIVVDGGATIAHMDGTHAVPAGDGEKSTNLGRTVSAGLKAAAELG